VIWVLVIPACLLMTVVLTALADGALREEEEVEEPCAHPWYIDGRCIVCGHPR
jgi:hypothetical protein